jgi:hypothetical protein
MPTLPTKNPNEPEKSYGKAKAENNSGMAYGSLFCGVMSFPLTFLPCLPILGLLLAIIGLVFGLKGRKSDKNGIAILGIVLNSIYLLMSFFICSRPMGPR